MKDTKYCEGWQHCTHSQEAKQHCDWKEIFMNPKIL